VDSTDKRTQGIKEILLIVESHAKGYNFVLN